MSILAHILAAGGAAALIHSAAGYSHARRLLFPDDRLRVGGFAALLVLTIVVPFVLALVVNTLLGMTEPHPVEWLPYSVTGASLLATLRARGVQMPLGLTRASGA